MALRFAEAVRDDSLRGLCRKMWLEAAQSCEWCMGEAAPPADRLVVEGLSTGFAVHRVVLAGRCPFFRRAETDPRPCRYQAFAGLLDRAAQEPGRGCPRLPSPQSPAWDSALGYVLRYVHIGAIEEPPGPEASYVAVLLCDLWGGLSLLGAYLCRRYGIHVVDGARPLPAPLPIFSLAGAFDCAASSDLEVIFRASENGGAQDTTWQLHRALLAGRSGYFAAALAFGGWSGQADGRGTSVREEEKLPREAAAAAAGTTQEQCLDTAQHLILRPLGPLDSAARVQTVLHFLYTGEIAFAPASSSSVAGEPLADALTACEALEVARIFDIPALASAAESYFVQLVPGLSTGDQVDAVLDLWSLAIAFRDDHSFFGSPTSPPADRQRLEELEDLCLAYVSEHWSTVACHPDFPLLPRPAIEDLLSAGRVDAPEDAILPALRAWAEAYLSREALAQQTREGGQHHDEGAGRGGTEPQVANLDVEQGERLRRSAEQHSTPTHEVDKEQLSSLLQELMPPKTLFNARNRAFVLRGVVSLAGPSTRMGASSLASFFSRV